MTDAPSDPIALVDSGEALPTADGPQHTEVKGRQAALAFIFVTALLDIVAIGIIIPVLPKLVVQFAHSSVRGAQIYGLFGAAFAVMQLFCSPIQGALSDRFGRRPVLLTSIFGLGCDYVLMALSPNLVWLFVGRLISGATAASFSTANAYIADITPPEKRAAAFGMMGAAFGVGFILGPLLGGVLGQFNPRWPFWAAAGLALVNGLYGLFVLPESLPKDRRSPFRIKNANPLGSLSLYRSHPQLPQFATVLFLFYLSHQALQSTFVLYVGQRYHWGPDMVGMSLAATGLGSIVVQAGVVRPFVKRFGERGALYTGLACGAMGFAVYATAAQPWQYWFGVPIFALSGLIGPGIQGLMTRRVSPSQQGRLQGANSGLMALAGLIGPIFFTEVFAWSIGGGRNLPGLAIYASAALMTAALLLAIRAPKLEPAAYA